MQAFLCTRLNTIINLAMMSSEHPRTVQYNMTGDGISSSIRGFSH